MRMWQGASGRSPYLGIVSPAYTVLAPKEGVCTGFFARLFKNEGMIQTFEKNSQGLTSDTWNLKFPALSRIGVSVPVVEEQKTISGVFDHVERMISSATGRVQSLTSLKKTMLVKMFPQGTASTPEVRFEGFEGSAQNVYFTAGGKTRITADRFFPGAAVRVWDVATGREAEALCEQARWVTSVAWGPRGGLVAAGSVDRSVCVWRVRAG